jgi:putative MATE family efflux protein
MPHTSKLTLWALGWPIMIEMFLQFMIGTVDTLMVSHISDQAVAAVGICNQFFQVVLVLFVTVNSGAGIIIAQKLGAGLQEAARKAALSAVIVNIYLGAAISFLLYFTSGPIARLLQVPPDLFPLAQIYLETIGAGTFLTVLLLAFNTVIRNTGNTRGPMIIGIGMNLLHILGNYLFIYGAFGFPEWGLYGVALSTNFSRLVAVVFALYVFRQVFPMTIRFREFKRIDIPILKEINKVGWPLSVNASSWTFTQMIIFSLVATMGVNELAARTYMNTIESFSFLCGWSLALAVQIQIAHLYGAGRMREAYAAAWKAFYAGLCIVVLTSGIMFIYGKSILRLFTDDASIIQLSLVLFGLNLVLQPWKVLNMTFGNSLQAVGDTKFLMIFSGFSLWFVSVGFSYILGISLGWGLVGVYVAMIADEGIRGIISVVRWKKKRWMLGGTASQVNVGGEFSRTVH